MSKYIILIVVLVNMAFAKECMIISSSAEIYKNPYNKDKAYLKDRYRYMFSYREQSQEEQRYEVEVDKWVDKNDTVCNENSNEKYLKSKKVELKVKENEIVKNISTQLSKKIFIINDVSSDDSDIVNVKYYSTPEMKRGSELGEITIYEIYFVYDMKTINGKEVYLIGKDQKVIKTNSKTVLGWVSSDYATEWNTKLAAEAKKGVKVFYSEDFKETLYIEPDDKDISYYTMRYPLIETVDEDDDSYRINFMADKDKKSIELQTFSEILEQKEVYINFLLDNTGGMQNYIDNVKGAIDTFLKEFPSSNLRIAIATYRDYNDGNNEYKLWTTKGYVSPSEARILLDTIHADSYNDTTDYWKLQGYTDQDAKDKSIFEALFNGINNLLDESVLNFEKLSQSKVIILIGDHGNHTIDKYNLTENKIQEKLEEKNAYIRAIRVHYEKSLKKYSEAFTKQIRKIIDLHNGLGMIIEDNRGSKETIYRNIKQIIDELEIMKQDIKAGKISNWNKKLLELAGVDISKVGDVQQSSMGYMKGRDFNRVILAQQRDIASLSEKLYKIADEIVYYDDSMKDEFIDTLKSAIKSLTGDKIKNENNIKEFLENRLVLPIRTELLDRTLDQLIENIEEDEQFKDKLAKELFKKAIYLGALERERNIIGEPHSWDGKRWKVDYLQDKDENYIKKKARFNISIPIESRENDKDDRNKDWLWVPLEYLP